MARPRQLIDFTPDSLTTLLRQLHNQAEEVRLSAMRDYREIKTLTNAGDSAARVVNTVNLETARNNSLRSAREAVNQRTDLAKIQAGVMIAQLKADAAPAGDETLNKDALPTDLKAQLRAMARDIRKEEN